MKSSKQQAKKSILREKSAGQKIETSRQLKNRDSETQTTAKKTKLRDPLKSAKILRDPSFFEGPFATPNMKGMLSQETNGF